MVKLFVGNVPEKASGDDLRQLFSKYGVVNQSDILAGRGYGFVHMDSKEAAQSAILALQDSEFCGKKIHVELSKSGDRSNGRTSGGGDRAGGGSGNYGSKSINDRGNSSYDRSGGYNNGGGGPVRSGMGSSSSNFRDAPYSRNRDNFDRGGRERDYGGAPPRRGGRDMSPPPRDRRNFDNAGSSRGGGPPSAASDAMYEREMAIRDPVIRERLLREYERLLAIDRLDRSGRLPPPPVAAGGGGSSYDRGGPSNNSYDRGGGSYGGGGGQRMGARTPPGGDRSYYGGGGRQRSPLPTRRSPIGQNRGGGRFEGGYQRR